MSERRVPQFQFDSNENYQQTLDRFNKEVAEVWSKYDAEHPVYHPKIGDKVKCPNGTYWNRFPFEGTIIEKTVAGMRVEFIKNGKRDTDILTSGVSVVKI